MTLNKYNNLVTPRRCYTKDPKDSHIWALFGVSQKLVYDSKKISYNSNMEPTKGEPAYSSDHPPWMLEGPNGAWDTRPMMVNNISGARNNAQVKASGYATRSWKAVQHLISQWRKHQFIKWGRRTKINNNVTLTKDCKAVLLAIKEINGVQSLISHFNLTMRPGTGERIIPQYSKCILTLVNSNPTTT